jgi:type II secretory pathway component PulM
MPSLSARDRRAFLLGLAVLVPPILYLWGVRPYTAALAETRGRVTAGRAALARERALLALAPQSAALRTALDSVLRASEARLFGARDDGIAAAELGTYLGELARGNQVWLQAANARGAQVSPTGVRTLAVDIRAESDFQGIVTFLRALEGGEKLVRVDQLTLVPVADTTTSHRALQLRATVIGYALGDPPRPAPAKPARPNRR